MSSSRRLRLDEILFAQGMVTEEQVTNALLRQKAHGGKFGSQLLYYRYIDEAGLVKALATQIGCEGVVLSGLKIPPLIIEAVPKKVALSRRVMPFEYDSRANILRIACEDPADRTLIDELEFVARGKEIRLYVAAEIALNTAIARYYLKRDVSLDDNLLLSIPESVTVVDDDCSTGDVAHPVRRADANPEVLFVTDEAYSAPLLQALLERDGYSVTITGSVAGAIRLLVDRQFETFFIRYSVPGDYLELIDRARRISPRTSVRYYDKASSLLMSKDYLTSVSDLHVKNLDLFTSLLASKDRLSTNHSGRVGQYVDKLCRKLGLPDRDRLIVTNAAFVHDLGRYQYHTEDVDDNRAVIQLTIRLLESLSYPAVVLQMLRSMYVELQRKCGTSLPIEVLGGNILTIVDLFCDSIPEHTPLTLDRFDAVIKKTRALAGKLLLAEVVEGFIEMIQHEILGMHATQKSSQVAVFSSDLILLQPLELRLKNEGFRTVSHVSAPEFAELYRRSKPDLLIVVAPGEPEEIMSVIGELVSGGVSFEETPTFLQMFGSSISRMTDVLERGIEDIVALEDNLDLLITKIHKVEARITARAGKRSQGNVGNEGAHGRLAEMNLIDLMQALGPSRKTVKITIRNHRDKNALTLYLEQGDIVHAHLGELAGPPAVYEAITWADGSWTIEPVVPDDLPAPNNHESNESLLMEGCRLLDEKARAGQLL